MMLPCPAATAGGIWTKRKPERKKDAMISSGFPPASEIARLTARALLEVGAVHFNATTPFTLASGLPSPTYIDCRKLISYPRIRSMLMDFMVATVMRDAGFEAFDNIAGGETAGIPFAALVAERLALPMTYVRKKPKGYGKNARIEGEMTAGQRVLLVEDLTTDGGSKLSFVDAIRETGATCAHTAVIFYYDIFPGTQERLAGHGVALHHLCTWWDVLSEAKAQAAFDEATLAEVERFLTAPRAWQEAHGVPG
jgi:orotate phosphoribosyltransferase